MGIKDYYERQYGGEGPAKLRLPFLFRILRRFELDRNDLTCQLAPGGDSLLDIGCGDGELLLLLKDKYRHVYGIDVAKPRIDLIRENFSNESNIQVVLGDVNYQLPFKDNSFDTITVISVLEHIFDPYHVMKECRRLLSKKGTLILQVPNIAWLPNRIRALTGKVPEAILTDGDEWDYEHLHYFTRASLKRLLEREGFRVTRTTSGGILAKPRRIWGSLLSSDIFMVGIKIGE